MARTLASGPRERRGSPACPNPPIPCGPARPRDVPSCDFPGQSFRGYFVPDFVIQCSYPGRGELIAEVHLIQEAFLSTTGTRLLASGEMFRIHSSSSASPALYFTPVALAACHRLGLRLRWKRLSVTSAVPPTAMLIVGNH